MVEHDEDAIRAADYLVDMGPGAGVHGGQVVAEGTPAKVEKAKASITGQYLSGARAIPVPDKRRPRKTGRALRIEGARANNLDDLTVEFPMGIMTCVTGVSGSGKSTLTLETLHKALARHLHGSRDTPGAHKAIKGMEQVDKIIVIDQSPIGRTPRSNPATYTGLFTPIRDLFAGTQESRARGLSLIHI